MLTTIAITVLDTVTGGAARPQYLASQPELSRRTRMTAQERAAADDQWKKTFASLSPERKAAIRNRAVVNSILAHPTGEAIEV